MERPIADEMDRLDRLSYERDRFLDRAVRILAGVVADRGPGPDRGEATNYLAKWAKELTVELYWICGFRAPEFTEDIEESRAEAIRRGEGELGDGCIPVVRR